VSLCCTSGWSTIVTPSMKPPRMPSGPSTLVRVF